MKIALEFTDLTPSHLAVSSDQIGSVDLWGHGQVGEGHLIHIVLNTESLT